MSAEQALALAKDGSWPPMIPASRLPNGNKRKFTGQ
jgi:hypothetical protein